MNRFLLVALCLTGGSAYASEQYPLFDHPAHAEDKEAARAIASLMRNCSFSEMSRIGPSEEDVAACDRSEKRALKLGSRSVVAAIDAVDSEKTGGRMSSRYRLYDIIGRVGDTAFVEPLVQALEREEAAGMGNARQFERDSMARALEQITYTQLKGTPAIQWRQWLDTHKGKTRDELLAERLAHVDEALAHGTLDDRIDSAIFLASRPVSRPRARELLTAIRKSEELTPEQRMRLQNTLDKMPAASTKLTTAS